MLKHPWLLAVFALWQLQTAPVVTTSPLEILTNKATDKLTRVVLRNIGAKTITAYYFSAWCAASAYPAKKVGSRTDFSAATAFSEGGIKPGQAIERSISLTCPGAGDNAVTARAEVVVFDDATWMSSDDRQLRFIAEFRKTNTNAYREWVGVLEDPALEAKYRSGDDQSLKEFLSGRPQAIVKAHRDDVPMLEDYLKALLDEGVAGWATYRNQLKACRKLHEAFARSQLRVLSSRPPAEVK